MTINQIGYRAGVAAFAAAFAYDVVQVLQLVGVFSFPLDEILIYGTSLCITVPFLLEMLAFHHLTDNNKQFWTHAALLFTVLYVVFVSSNYVVQLATVIPSKIHGNSEGVSVLEQTPHSLFWNFDALGYISMGCASLLVVPALARGGLERWTRMAFLGNALVTPLIGIVYFYPTYTPSLLFLGMPWAITAPLCMILLAMVLRDKNRQKSGTAPP